MGGAGRRDSDGPPPENEPIPSHPPASQEQQENDHGDGRGSPAPGAAAARTPVVIVVVVQVVHAARPPEVVSVPKRGFEDLFVLAQFKFVEVLRLLTSIQLILLL